MPPPDFAFDGQYAFLTYPRSGELSRERLRDFAVGTWGVARFLIARELHEDGNPHLHALLYWKRRKRFRGADCFDVDGNHPNIQRPRDIRDVYTYVRKDDGGCLESETPICNVERDVTWRGILSDASNADEFLLGVERRYTRDFVLHHNAVVSFAEKRWGPVPEEFIGRRRDEFIEHPRMTEWVRKNIEEHVGNI